MTKIDQFESAFKAAAKEVFRYEPVQIQSVLVVTDMTDGATPFAAGVRKFLQVVDAEGELQLEVVQGNAFDTVGKLVELVESATPDLVCSYRNLHSMAWRWPHSLGTYLDVLTQVAQPPVLVMPHPAECPDFDPSRGTATVMAITDHLAGDHRLVNYGATLTKHGGKLLLTHVEDSAALDRVIETIAKIPDLDTDHARAEIPRQLLQEPHDYVRSCRAVLQERALPIVVEETVCIGHLLNDHLRIVAQHGADLLVLNTKDDDQTAMHGLAYPLSVELRNTPLLML